MLLGGFFLFVCSKVKVRIGLRLHASTLHHIAKLDDKEVQRTAVEHQMMDV